MELESPITVQFRENPLTLSRLRVVLVDDSSEKAVDAHIRPFPKAIRLWEGEAYDQAGDYTQAQAEARIRELLGTDMAAFLAGLDDA